MRCAMAGSTACSTSTASSSGWSGKARSRCRPRSCMRPIPATCGCSWRICRSTSSGGPSGPPVLLFLLDRRGLFLEQRLPAQANLAGRVDVDHLDQQLLAFLELVAHVLDAVVRDL